MALRIYPVPEFQMDPLSSRAPVDDETAKRALREFFEAVLAADGRAELVRIYEAFYMQAHGDHPPMPYDWSDDTPDGCLKVNPSAKAASNKA